MQCVRANTLDMPTCTIVVHTFRFTAQNQVTNRVINMPDTMFFTRAHIPRFGARWDITHRMRLLAQLLRCRKQVRKHISFMPAAKCAANSKQLWETTTTTSVLLSQQRANWKLYDFCWTLHTVPVHRCPCTRSGSNHRPTDLRHAQIGAQYALVRRHGAANVSANVDDDGDGIWCAVWSRSRGWLCTAHVTLHNYIPHASLYEINAVHVFVMN